MGCACKGERRVDPLTGSVPAAPGEEWEVVYPNGDTAPFPDQKRASMAAAMSGGRARRTTRGKPPQSS